MRDPELDEPITALGFVASCTVSCEGRAAVRLRLPTYFCAPNFAYLMVADAYDAVTAVPGVTVRRGNPRRPLRLRRRSTPASPPRPASSPSFDGEAVAELGDLRAQFLRKAVMAGTDQVCRPLVAAGVTPGRAAGADPGRRPRVAGA